MTGLIIDSFAWWRDCWTKMRKEDEMPLDKSILHGKEHRKPYRRAKAVDRQCRNHGKCYWCEMQRLYARIKRGMGGKG